MSEIRFRNSADVTINLAIMFWSPDQCRDYGKWGTRGWWVIQPGDMKFVLRTDSQFAAYYVLAQDGREITGSYGPVYVYSHAFDSCVNIGSTAASDVVGMKLIDTGGKDYIVNIIP
jgi:uncharacterized membrane protein